jgi:hypothetical protein
MDYRKPLLLYNLQRYKYTFMTQMSFLVMSCFGTRLYTQLFFDYIPICYCISWMYMLYLIFASTQIFSTSQDISLRVIKLQKFLEQDIVMFGGIVVFFNVLSHIWLFTADASLTVKIVNLLLEFVIVACFYNLHNGYEPEQFGTLLKNPSVVLTILTHYDPTDEESYENTARHIKQSSVLYGNELSMMRQDIMALEKDLRELCVPENLIANILDYLNCRRKELLTLSLYDQ